MRIDVQLRLLVADERSGRTRGIGGGYRATWRGPRKPDHNDAAVHFDARVLEPGDESAAWLVPLAEHLWVGRVDVGDRLEGFDGKRVVAHAQVISIDDTRRDVWRYPSGAARLPLAARSAESLLEDLHLAASVDVGVEVMHLLIDYEIALTDGSVICFDGPLGVDHAARVAASLFVELGLEASRWMVVSDTAESESCEPLARRIRALPNVRSCTRKTRPG